MLELGVMADVAAATSATMIAFTSAAACCVYVGFGLVPYDYGAVLLGLGLAGSVVGQLATTRIVKALGRRSFIVFLMTLLVGGVLWGGGWGESWAGFAGKEGGRLGALVRSRGDVDRPTTPGDCSGGQAGRTAPRKRCLPFLRWPPPASELDIG
jgi:hypothetical protein